MADLIDRERLKKDMCASCAEFDECDGPLKTYCWAMHIVDAQPTVDAEKHGRWMTKTVVERNPFARNWYCSECKLETHFCGNYCPNCGARCD